MNIEEIAKRLNGRDEYSVMDGISKEELEEKNIVVVFGYSDDGINFHGAIEEQMSCYGGGTFYITKEGLLSNKCDDVYCPYFREQKENTKTKIEAVWGSDGYCWIYNTNIPHFTFDVMEENEDDKFCRGIIFWLHNLEDESTKGS